MTVETDDELAFALDVAEAGSVLLRFESAVGRHARFGYARGRWCLASSSRDNFVATSVDREDVRQLLEESETTELVDARNDPVWRWFLQDGDSDPMVRAHCTCGEFMYSTRDTPVEEWREKHKDACYHTPSIEYDD